MLIEKEIDILLMIKKIPDAFNSYFDSVTESLKSVRTLMQSKTS